MKRMLIALVALGAVVVVTAAAAAPTVTINVSDRTIVYGGTPTLNGTAAPNTTVTITAKPFNEAAWTTQVQTGSNGVWQLQVSPWVQTRYQASAAGSASEETVILVKPRVQFLRRGPGRYEVIIAAGRSFVGKQVMLGKEVGKTRATRHWVMVKKVVMQTNVRTQGVTTAYFGYKAHRGDHLKIFLQGAVAQSLGYQGITSNFIVV